MRIRLIHSCIAILFLDQIQAFQFNSNSGSNIRVQKTLVKKNTNKIRAEKGKLNDNQSLNHLLNKNEKLMKLSSLQDIKNAQDSDLSPDEQILHELEQQSQFLKTQEVLRNQKTQKTDHEKKNHQELIEKLKQSDENEDQDQEDEQQEQKHDPNLVKNDNKHQINKRDMPNHGKSSNFQNIQINNSKNEEEEEEEDDYEDDDDYHNEPKKQYTIKESNKHEDQKEKENHNNEDHRAIYSKKVEDHENQDEEDEEEEQSDKKVQDMNQNKKQIHNRFMNNVKHDSTSQSSKNNINNRSQDEDDEQEDEQPQKLDSQQSNQDYPVNNQVNNSDQNKGSDRSKNTTQPISHQNSTQISSSLNTQNILSLATQNAPIINIDPKFQPVNMVQSISDFAKKQLNQALKNPNILRPLQIGKKVYLENNMVFDDQPLVITNIVETQVTPIQSVSKENKNHILKQIHIDPKYKQANDRDAMFPPGEGQDYNVQTQLKQIRVQKNIPASIILKKKINQKLQDFINIDNPLKGSIQEKHTNNQIERNVFLLQQDNQTRVNTIKKNLQQQLASIMF